MTSMKSSSSTSPSSSAPYYRFEREERRGTDVIKLAYTQNKTLSFTILSTYSYPHPPLVLILIIHRRAPSWNRSDKPPPTTSNKTGSKAAIRGEQDVIDHRRIQYGQPVCRLGGPATKVLKVEEADGE